MKFRVLHHNNCFDGACSAAIFTKFHQECIGGADSYEYCGLAHQPGGMMADSIFGPGENAIVDFKYSMSPQLTWWFDHHESAFLTPVFREHFLAGQKTELVNRQFLDVSYISCTNFIADIGRARFGFDTSALGDLLHWANIIDGARFESAQAAVEMKPPAMKLAMVIENAGSEDFIPRIIPMLTTMSFADILAQPFVAERVAPLMAQHEAMQQLVRERSEVKDGVISLAILDREVDALNKFIPYYYHPEATYTIALTRSRTRVKISVGTSPWTPLRPEQLVNLSAVCERYGGGGHARVGAISLTSNEVEKAQQIAAEVVAELQEVERKRT